jgi:hypothetical protein
MKDLRVKDMKCSPLERPLTIVFVVFTSPNLSDWAILKVETCHDPTVSDLGEKPTAAFGLGWGFWFAFFRFKSDGRDHEDRTKLRLGSYGDGSTFTIRNTGLKNVKFATVLSHEERE